MKKILFTAFSLILLSGCASNEQQKEIDMLADYRASVLSSVLPLEIGPLTLLRAKAKHGVVEMMFLDSGNGKVSTTEVIEKSITTFCKDNEVRPVIDKGVTYQYIIRNSRGQQQNNIIVNEQSCLDREQTEKK
ncbi:hypothetical protein EIJ81_07490 [Aliivibrio salmonicida]|uniref:Type IV secretion system putative lipoprotein virB7 n=1 Tax=Aliivibrio salmonicida (strain LFI1238) TaxID=316275 RepID=B6EJ98_ALISL|nr:type II secretion system pilot lipoprotein GspS-beta [Aliivibrio salmonicida]AZL84474.1 hypothetical protein EIJ81_07490 [Aliivibrio salmonicida]CAQ78829.1 putative lipoprotein [Aliivibrio salmonicida LFI1238]